MITIRNAKERGHANHGWLETYHTFSFADYHDPKWMGFRSLRVINDDLILPKMGFGTHGHKDMEIITYVLSGTLAHKDSMGNGSRIEAGDVQYMAAGSGIHHSEFNPSEEEAVHLLQIWIVPDKEKAAPRYEEKTLKNAPSGKLYLVASKTGRNGSIAINQDADLWLGRLDAGHRVQHALAPDRHAWLHIAQGEVRLNGQLLQSGDAAAVSSERWLDLEAIQPSPILLFDLN